MGSYNGSNNKRKVLFILGSTGSGKSKLSITLATKFSAEIINSDKMQVYKGLDIITNKVTEEEQLGIPHHLLGVFESNAEFTASDFREQTLRILESIVERNHLPIIVGGSNNYIEALVDDEENEFRSKYEFCCIWLDVTFDVLRPHLAKRVDEMVDKGLVNEVRGFYGSNVRYDCGVGRSIGAPEMDLYLRLEPTVDKKINKVLLEMTMEEIKLHTCKLACNQIVKIHRLRTLPGWNVHRIDATDVFRSNDEKVAEVWEQIVMKPSTIIAEQFLHTNVNSTGTCITSNSTTTCATV